jgi:putative spermidine/putrescine transport system substrate-binding protein
MAVVFNSGFSARALFSVSLGLFGLASISAKATNQITFVSQGGAYQKA